MSLEDYIKSKRENSSNYRKPINSNYKGNRNDRFSDKPHRRGNQNGGNFRGGSNNRGNSFRDRGQERDRESDRNHYRKRND